MKTSLDSTFENLEVVFLQTSVGEKVMVDAQYLPSAFCNRLSHQCLSWIKSTHKKLFPKIMRPHTLWSKLYKRWVRQDFLDRAHKNEPNIDTIEEHAVKTFANYPFEFPAVSIKERMNWKLFFMSMHAPVTDLYETVSQHKSMHILKLVYFFLQRLRVVVCSTIETYEPYHMANMIWFVLSDCCFIVMLLSHFDMHSVDHQSSGLITI